MKDILKNSKEAIFRDKSKGGLLVSFTIAYQKDSGKKLNVNCGKCVEKAYREMTNKYLKKMSKEIVKCDWELHFKYNGIQLGTNGQPIRNGEMTNAIAQELHDKHPHGAKLFKVIPEQKAKKKAPKRPKTTSTLEVKKETK